MSLEELKKKSAKTRMLASALADEVTASLEDYEFREDRRGRECLFVTWNIDNNLVTIKYTPSTYQKLAEFLEKHGMKSLSELRDKLVRLKRMYGGQERQPRHYPIEVLGKYVKSNAKTKKTKKTEEEEEE